MPLRWKIFRTLCIIQLLVASLMALTHIFSFFRFIAFSNIAGLGLFTGILFLCVLGINLLNNNYPDEPVEGTIKKNFNRTFLLNFLLLSVLFGFVVAEYRGLVDIAALFRRDISSLDASFYLMLIAYVITLILQLAILYGLYRLRLELYDNFLKRKFDFEKDKP